MPDLKKKDISGTIFTWRECGDGEVVFLLHGISCASGVWSPVMRELSEYYRVIALDLPGYGGSENLKNSQASVQSYADLAVAFLDSFDIRKVHLVGQSLSALIAARIAADKLSLAESLTLSHPFVGLGSLPESERSRIAEARLKIFQEMGPVRFAHEKGPAILASNAPDFARVTAVSLMSEVTFEAMSRAINVLRDGDIFMDLRKIKTPTMVVTGEFDPIAPQDYCRSIVHKSEICRLEVISGSGHYSCLEDPEAYSALLGRFMAGQTTKNI